MPTTFDILAIRKRLGRQEWGVPKELGIDTWWIDHLREPKRAIISDVPGGFIGDPEHDWIHASMGHRDRLPTYEEMVALHRAVWPEGYAYEVHVPEDEHINIHQNVLHLWGRADGSAALPDFGQYGSI